MIRNIPVRVPVGQDIISSRQIAFQLRTNSGVYELAVKVELISVVEIDVVYVKYKFIPESFVIGITGTLLADVRTTYNELLNAYPHLPMLCDRVVFEIADSLSSRDEQEMVEHAQRLGIYLLIRHPAMRSGA